MDDVYVGMQGMGRGKGNYQPEGGEKKTGTWSCVDYVDDVAHGTEGEAERKLGAVPVGRGLSVRFGSESGAAFKAGDGPGTCREQKTGASGNKHPKTCGEEDYATMSFAGGVLEETYTSNKWYTGKHTNHGWPGTAEGKINTAQGMAGDLVSNLNREEKSDVAGI